MSNPGPPGKRPARFVVQAELDLHPAVGKDRGAEPPVPDGKILAQLPHVALRHSAVAQPIAR